jgi:hypothetical protein
LEIGALQHGRTQPAHPNIAHARTFAPLTKMGRKPLKSHEIAKSDISRANDFNSL